MPRARGARPWQGARICTPGSGRLACPQTQAKHRYPRTALDKHRAPLSPSPSHTPLPLTGTVLTCGRARVKAALAGAASL